MGQNKNPYRGAHSSSGEPNNRSDYKAYGKHSRHSASFSETYGKHSRPLSGATPRNPVPPQVGTTNAKNNSTPTHQYSRDNSNYTQRKRKKPWKKALAIVGLVILLVVGVGVGYAAWYKGNLANNISYDGDLDALNNVLSDVNYEEPFYILVIGSDSWQDFGARSDAMVLVRVDLQETKITMVSVPRDTPFELHGQTVKLNAVFQEQGEAACIDAVSQITGVDIAHYVELEFDQLANVIDSLGGITVNVPYAIDYKVYTNDQDTVHIDAGEQLLNGEQAVAFARMRTAYNKIEDKVVTQDAVRQSNVRSMMVATIKKVLDAPVTELPDRIANLAGMVKTDISIDTLIDWALKFGTASDITIWSCTGPTSGDYDDETGLWLTEEAPEAWAALMNVVDAGDNPTDVLTASPDGSIKLQTEEIISKNDTAG